MTEMDTGSSKPSSGVNVPTSTFTFITLPAFCSLSIPDGVSLEGLEKNRRTRDGQNREREIERERQRERGGDRSVVLMLSQMLSSA